MPEMVHYRIATDPTTEDRTAVVIRFGKQMEKKSTILSLFPDSAFPKIGTNATCFLWRYLKENEGYRKLIDEATRSQSVEKWLWKRPWTCRETLRHASPGHCLEINRSII